MGWCSGTDVFDPIAKALIKYVPDKKTKKELIRVLTVALEDMDWDCQFDSDLADNKLVREVWREIHPNWYNENE